MHVDAPSAPWHAYTAYGLALRSSFPLPELRPAEPGPADITIRRGDVPESLESPSSFGLAWQAGPEQLLLSVDAVARYLIVGNADIRVEPLAGSDESDVRVFLLGSVLGALLHTRALLVLHASAIETPRGAVLFAGRTGVGKSTLLAAFLQRGYRMIADDKAAIRLDDGGRAVSLPGFPVVRLTHTAATALDYPVMPSHMRASADKYITPVGDFCAATLPVHAVYVLRSHNQRSVQFDQLQTVDAFNAVNAATYRRRFLRDCDRRNHFQLVSAVARGARISRVVRPDCTFDVDSLRALIEEDFSA